MKNKRINSRLTEKELALFEARRIKANLSQSDFIRMATLNDNLIIVAKDPPKEKPSIDKQRMLYLYNKTSNNLNQLAHRLNSDNKKGSVTESTYSSILNELLMIRLLLNEGINRAD